MTRTQVIRGARVETVHVHAVPTPLPKPRLVPSIRFKGTVSQEKAASLRETLGALLGAGDPNYDVLSHLAWTIEFVPEDTPVDSSSLVDLAVLVEVMRQAYPGATPYDQRVWLGQVTLNGEIHSPLSMLPYVLDLSTDPTNELVGPYGHAEDLRFTDLGWWGVGSIEDLWCLLGIQRYAMPTLQELADNSAEALDGIGSAEATQSTRHGPLLEHVMGHDAAKHALIMAMAGGHHMLMVGPPGVGKSLLAACAPALLPELSPEEALEVARIHCIAGQDYAPTTVPPFVALDPNITEKALIGGGSINIEPGFVSLAHRGVLYIDEVLQCRCINSLRTALQDGIVTVGRVGFKATLPARVQLLGSTNPCPCGYHGVEGKECTCRPWMVQRYQGRMEGPIVDRMDIVVHMSDVHTSELAGDLTTEEAHGAVVRARALQLERYVRGGVAVMRNSELTPGMVDKLIGAVPLEVRTHAGSVADEQGLNMRRWHKLWMLAQTYADLTSEGHITPVCFDRAASLIGGL